jgi:hypothetical protein
MNSDGSRLLFVRETAGQHQPSSAITRNMVWLLSFYRVPEDNRRRLFYQSSSCSSATFVEATVRQTPEMTSDMVGGVRKGMAYNFFHDISPDVG